MTRFLNLLWFLTMGSLMGLILLVFGIVCFVSIIFIPFGWPCWKLAWYSLFPFGKSADVDFESHFGLNMFWAIFFGAGLAGFYLTFGVIMCCTIVLIPFGVASFRLIKPSFAPFGATMD